MSYYTHESFPIELTLAEARQRWSLQGTADTIAFAARVGYVLCLCGPDAVDVQEGLTLREAVDLAWECPDQILFRGTARGLLAPEHAALEAERLDLDGRKALARSWPRFVTHYAPRGVNPLTTTPRELLDLRIAFLNSCIALARGGIPAFPGLC